MNLLSPIIAMLVALFLILKPLTVARFIGNIYWQMARFTLMKRTEENKKFFFAENPFWFRVFGIIWLTLCLVAIVFNVRKQ